MQNAVKALTKRKTCKQRYVQAEETLVVSKVANLVAIKESSSYRESETPANRVRSERRCGRYGEIRHNSYTYKIEIENINSSNASK